MFKYFPGKKTVIIGVWAFALLFCGGCTQSYEDPSDISASNTVQNPEQNSQTQAIAYNYRVGPDDEIMLRVFGEDDLTGSYVVAANGVLAIPLIGNVYVEGLNLFEIQNKITALLKDGYLVEPQVTVEITKYRPFYILGEVKVPGSYSYVSNMNILNAVAVAGGFTYRANTRTVDIKRVHQGHTQIIPNEKIDTIILPGDIVIVKERFF